MQVLRFSLDFLNYSITQLSPLNKQSAGISSPRPRPLFTQTFQNFVG